MGNPENGFLLLSKLKLPPPITSLVPRPRLITQLNEGLSCRATFITAPAGYGKTTLVSDWARQLSLPAGWLSLDDKDNDPVRFWNHVVEAMEQAWGPLSDVFHAASATLSPGQFEPFLVALLNELNRLCGVREPFVLVLDDWHVIADPGILASVAYLLEYLPASVHICFSGRTAAGFVRARWISRGWIREISAKQLSFDLQETEVFFQATEKREMPREWLERALVKTEGWVTGLKLVALASRDKSWPEALRDVESGPAAVEQFLFEEAFEALDEPTRRFLLDVSILQRMNGSLCDAVSGKNGADKLTELAERNLFLISLDENKEWFRFHHLFGEFLLKELKRREPERVSLLFHAAAAWCESQNLLEEAVDYYLAGACYPEAIRLLERMKSMMIRREFSTMKLWLSAIPEALLLRHPYLYFSYIYSLLWGQEPELAESHLQLAEQHYEADSAGWSREERDRYLGYLYYIRNFKATQFDMDMIKGLEYVRLSLQYSPNGTDLIFASPQIPLSPSVYRSYNGKRGKHLPRGLADSFFLSMIEFMEPMGLHDSVVVCYGELLYERDELEQAEAYLKRALQDQNEKLFQPEKVYVPASLFLSRISRARQELSEAESWLKSAALRAAGDGAKAALILLEAEMAMLRLDSGDLTQAVEWRDRYKLTSDDPVSVYQLFVYIALVRVLMETQNLQEAWALSERLLPIAVKGHRPMEALEIQVLQAMMLQAAEKPQQALLKLEEALKFAQPDEYIRVFADKGKRAAELLAVYVEQRQKGNLRDKDAPSLAFVRNILSAFAEFTGAESPHSGRSALETLLTPREQAIFRCMEAGLDNPAIVEELGIGMGTLKAHINHIYGKLQVKNRVEALKRGQEMQG